MSRYLVTGFNSETGEIFRGEEIDQAGAEHMASSWVSERPLGSCVEGLLHEIVKGEPQLTHAFLCKRVLGGIAWGES